MEGFDEAEFEQATRPAIEYLQKHGFAMSTIVIEWDKATLQLLQYSYGGVPVPD